MALANLADAVAALPQAARQIGDILEDAKDDHVLEMDALTETNDPTLANGAARLTSTRSANRAGRGRAGLHLARPSPGGSEAAADGQR